jgi:hypothetical protein
MFVIIVFNEVKARVKGAKILKIMAYSSTHPNARLCLSFRGGDETKT